MGSKTEKILAFIEERIEWNVDMMKRDPKPSDIGRIEEAKCIRRFIESLQEEPVSEDLEEAANKYGTKKHPMTTIGANESAYDFKAGANWQKAKDQETIELAEDHGMEKMKEQMMSVAVEGRLYSTICGLEQNIVVPAGYGKYGKDGDKIKVVILKDA